MPQVYADKKREFFGKCVRPHVARRMRIILNSSKSVIRGGGVAASKFPIPRMAIDLSSLSSLSIFAASKDQIEESWRRTFEEWGKTDNLSLEQYQMREESLAAMETSKDGKLVIW
jgi:hypothetical protein